MLAMWASSCDDGVGGCSRSSFPSPLPAVKLPLFICHVTYVFLLFGNRRDGIHLDMAWHGRILGRKAPDINKGVRGGGGLLAYIFLFERPAAGGKTIPCHGTARQIGRWCCLVPPSRLAILHDPSLPARTYHGALALFFDVACRALSMACINSVQSIHRRRPRFRGRYSVRAITRPVSRHRRLGRLTPTKGT